MLISSLPFLNPFLLGAFLVETKGRTLEETAAIFDGESYTQNLQNIGNEAATHSRHIYNPDVKEDLEIEMASTRM